VKKVNPTVGITHLRAGDQLIDFLQVAESAIGKNLDHFCLRIEPFDYAHLQKYFHDQGIATLRYDTRYSALGYGFSVYVRDPDGAEIEFIAAKNEK